MLKDAEMPLMDRSWGGGVKERGGEGQEKNYKKPPLGTDSNTFFKVFHGTPRLMFWVTWKVIHAFLKK